MTQIIDISYKNGEGLARQLSNLCYRPFKLRGHRFASMEGFLQSIKVTDPIRADYLAGLHGPKAFLEGQDGNDWKDRQTLHFDGETFARCGIAYNGLLRDAYEAQLKQNPEFIEKLRASTGSRLAHTMGKNDPTDSVLTAAEYLSLLNYFRDKVLDGDYNDHLD